MKTSKHGITLIEGREGIRLKVYRDSKGLPTVGVGHLVVPADGLKVGDKITQDQCDTFLANDLKTAENAVNKAVNVPLTQNQFDALVSFTVNIGASGFRGSAVVAKLNAKDYNGAAEALMHWVKPVEITGRRKTEQKQFLTPDPISAAQEPKAGTAQTPTEDAGGGTPTAETPTSTEPPPTI